jgi:hypothetical protein
VPLTQKTAENYLIKWFEYTSTGDREGFISLFPRPHEDILLIGSAKDEIRKNYNEVLKQFDRDTSEFSSFKINWIKTIGFQTYGDICWIANHLSTTFHFGNDKLEFYGRTTAILEMIDDKLQIRHMHVSLPQSGTEEGKSFPSINGMYKQLKNWIDEYDMNPNITEELKQSQLLNYLVKAKEITKTTK